MDHRRRDGMDIPARILANTRRSVQDRGWTGFYTPMPGQPANYGYTVGFTHTFGFPEAIVTGLDLHTSNAVLATLAERLAAGERPAFHVAIDLDLSLPVVLRPVTRATTRRLLLQATAFYAGAEYEAVQVVWPDPDGRFPWEAGHRPAGSYQPLLFEGAPPN